MAVPNRSARRREEALAQAVALRTAQLERVNRDLDAFARELAHELRTPVGQVAALAQLMLERIDSRPEVDLRRWLALQIEASRQMRETIQDLLDMARSAAPLNVEAIDLSALCERLRDNLCEGPRAAPVQWQIEPGMRVHGDAAQVAVLMRNLLANALKFTREVRNPVISITEDAARVVVEDNGAGFDEARAAHLFQPFARLHAQTQFEGTGLGLSIARRIVERHGGWIRARAQPGRGARFELTLAH